MNSKQRAISPEELFSRLMEGNFKQSECVDEATKMSEEKELLINLIEEYEIEIQKSQQRFAEEQKLLEIRERLLYELDLLKQQRMISDARIDEEIQNIQIKPEEMREKTEWTVQINEVRTRNNKLRVRIREMMEYIKKLELQNMRLQEERKIIQTNEINRLQGLGSGEDWRARIQILKRQQLTYEQDLRMKIKAREEAALKNIQSQQIEIRQRNRLRMQNAKYGKKMNEYYVQKQGGSKERANSIRYI